MRAGIENWLLQHWYGPGQPPWYLCMLEPLYKAAFQRSQKRKRNGSAGYRSALPVVVVGNITAGGSGKTPLVIRLCQLAVEMGLNAGVASTGYGRQSRDTLLVTADSDTRLCGDEPVLLASRTGVPVVVAVQRLDAVKRLNEMELDVIFSDDGLQAADLQRDIEFCVVDGERGIGNGHMIPAGPLREATRRLALVDYIISNGEWAGKPDDMDVIKMDLLANGLSSLNGEAAVSVEDFRKATSGKPLHAIAAIGNPGRFFRMLEKLGITAQRHAFPDHHLFKKSDFDSISRDGAIIMTEKDAVKCRSLELENAWFVPVDTCLPENFEGEFKGQLAKLIKNG
jgi:tetraacyldisaccharide 4'-kinase